MFHSIEKAMEYASRRRIEQIDLKFSDLLGSWHHISLPTSRLGPELLAEGVGFDGGSVPGFKSVEHGDMVLLPDLGTGFFDPFLEAPSLSFVCNVAEADSREQFDRDPRGIARRAHVTRVIRSATPREGKLNVPAPFIFECLRCPALIKQVQISLIFRCKFKVIIPANHVNRATGRGNFTIDAKKLIIA